MFVVHCGVQLASGSYSATLEMLATLLLGSVDDWEM